MKKVLLYTTIYLFLSNISYALNISSITLENNPWKYTNLNISIPKETEILNHDVIIDKELSWKESIHLQENSEFIEYLHTKYWAVKINNLFQNDVLYQIWSDMRKQIFWSGEIIMSPKNFTTFSHTIHFNTHKKWEDIIFKIFPIQSNIRQTYNAAYKNMLGYSKSNWYPKIFIFDDILLPQNIKITYSFASNIEAITEELKIEKKYHVVKFKYDEYYSKDYSYAIIPYFEIKIPSETSALHSDILNISYSTIDDIYFTSNWWTKIQIIENWQPVPFVKYNTY